MFDPMKERKKSEALFSNEEQEQGPQGEDEQLPFDLEGGPMFYRDSTLLPNAARVWTFPEEQQTLAHASYRPVAVQEKDAQAGHLAPARKKGFVRSALPLILGALMCMALGGVAGWQLGKGTPATSRQSRYISRNFFQSMTSEQVIAQGRQSVVQINVQTTQGTTLGSGVIVDSRGYIVTNYHVVENGEHYQVVLFDGSSLPALVTGVDPADDLAVVKIIPPKRLTIMPIGDSSHLQVGDSVLAIGNPLGITQTVTSGIISALGRTVPEGQGSGVIIGAVQTDAAINPGNSGGALVNMRGQLIGIPTLVPLDPEFKTPASGVGFAIPSNRVKFLSTQLIEDGKVIHSGRPAIGATVTSVDASVAAQDGLTVHQGVLVVQVSLAGPASLAGLKAGDVIVQVNNRTISNTADLTDALVSKNPCDKVVLGVVRGTAHLMFQVKLGELKV